MRVEHRHCSHCGRPMTPRAKEGSVAYARRKFCNVGCLGQSKAARRFQRFWTYIDKRGPDECWHWTGGRSSRGYGQFATSERTYRAHRLALEFAGVSVPADKLVMHTCDNPPCCNPAHLRVGTSLDNNRDMIAKGRAVRLCGVANHNTKIPPDQRRSILARKGERLADLAEEYGVSRATICRIQKGGTCA